jgi:hypothetical protein
MVHRLSPHSSHFSTKQLLVSCERAGRCTKRCPAWL